MTEVDTPRTSRRNGTQRAARTPRERRTLLWIIITAAIVAVLAVAVATSGAWLTVQRTTGGNAITAASAELLVNGEVSGSGVAVSDISRTSDAAATASGNVAGVAEVELGLRNLGSEPVDWVVSMNDPVLFAADASTVLDAEPVSIAYYDVVEEKWEAVSLGDFIANPPVVSLSGVNLGADDEATVTLRVFTNESAGDEYEGASLSFTTEYLALPVG